MLIKQNEVDEHKLCGICETLGVEELLGQLAALLCELVQAAQKLRRVFKGTTHVALEDALVRLAEECADVALCIDTLMTVKLVNEVGMQNIGRYKTGRWYGRVCEDGKQ